MMENVCNTRSCIYWTREACPAADGCAEFVQKKMHRECTICGKPLEAKYFKCLDNFMLTKFFDCYEGTDNSFCSEECFCKHMSLEEVEDD